MVLVDNLHIQGLDPLISPRALKRDLPTNESIDQTVASARETINKILVREDPRLMLVVGPCSIHDSKAALEYAERLSQARIKYEDKLVILMRTYFEKPRTTIGWRGLINDPHLDGSFDMNEGLRTARELLLKITSLGLPTATEMLDPVSPQYISDLVCLATIGARTTESQTHRALASGVSMPVGFKNSTDGNVQVAIQGLLSAKNQHSFLGIDHHGVSCVVRTTGNPYGLVILRGSRSKANYDAESITSTVQMLESARLNPAIMVDCSHANSGYDYKQQEQVWQQVIEQRRDGASAIVGLMIESHLHEGKQEIPADIADLKYGVSITDACVSWETTERMLSYAYEAL